MEVYFSDNIEDIVIFEVKNSINENYKDQVLVEPGKVSLAFEFETISSVAGLLIATISLCHQIFVNLKKKKRWTKTRLLKLIEDELLRLGFTEYSNLTISGFEELTKRSKEPCNVSAKVEDDLLINLKIFRDGKVFRIIKE